MKAIDNVQSTVKPKEVEFDSNHVYVNSNIREISDAKVPMYSYTVTEYEKDEFLVALSDGQVTLGERATMLEDAILEMSEVIYA